MQNDLGKLLGAIALCLAQSARRIKCRFMFCSSSGGHCLSGKGVLQALFVRRTGVQEKVAIRTPLILIVCR